MAGTSFAQIAPEAYRAVSDVEAYVVVVVSRNRWSYW
jgi:hypothetical protein